MTPVHIRRLGSFQPFTEYTDPDLGVWFSNPPEQVSRCHECFDERRAEDLEISVNYDLTIIRCANGSCYTGWAREQGWL